MFLSSSYLWRLFGHLFSNVPPETDPCWTTEGSKIQPLSSLRGASAVRKFAENFRQNAEIVGNCVSHVLDVKHSKTNVGNLAANFRRTPEVQSALQTPLCTALSSFQFCSLGFLCLVARWHHNSQRFEPSISLPNCHGAFAHNHAMLSKGRSTCI